MTTISASKTLGIVLNPASYTNSVVIGPHVTVSNGGGAAISAFPSFAEPFRLQSDGEISAASVGVYLAPGGSVTNAVSASIIAGGLDGIYINAGVGYTLNYGSIVSASHFGVFLNGGGSVINAASGTITGISGVLTEGGIAGYALNYGTIVGTGVVGIFLNAGGNVTNGPLGSISGVFDGVLVNSAGTVTNYGRVSATATGTSGIGVELSLNGTIINTTGASIAGGIAALAGGEVISGFTSDDTIDLIGVQETIFDFAGGMLSLPARPRSSFCCLAATPDTSLPRRAPTAPIDGDGEGAAPGVLVPVRYLINGATIVREPVDEITYYHLELNTHGVLLAEGLPAQSYLDTGNRAAFAQPLAAAPLGAIEAAARMGA